MKHKLIFTLLALMLFVGAFSMPLSAYAYTPPEADEGASPSPSLTAGQSESSISNGKTITPDGTGTVVDKLSSTDGKEFYTITTPEENVFYLVIDTERDGDNVYFLNTVTEDDLMALAEKKDSGNGTSAIPAQPSEPQEPEASPSPEPEAEQPAKSDGNNSFIWLVLAVVAVGGAGYYFKIVRPKQQADYDDLDDESESEFGNEENDGIEPDEESEGE